jgi:hypothetical protein
MAGFYRTRGFGENGISADSSTAGLKQRQCQPINGISNALKSQCLLVFYTFSGFIGDSFMLIEVSCFAHAASN